MKRTWAAPIIGAALVLLLTGCGGSEAPQSKATPSATPTISKDQRFLNAVTAKNIEWPSGPPPDDELLSYPPRWCAAVADGHSGDWILSAMGPQLDLYPTGANWGTKVADARTLLVTAVTTYCPQYRTELITGLQDSGEY